MSAASAVPLVARPTHNKWLVTISITFGTLMGAIDASIVNVALPHIRGAVGATVQEITWITTGYAIALVLVMPLTAFLGRMFGQKRVYMVSLALFLVGSILCGLAGSLVSLVFFRALQGFGAGALQPTEQAILRQTFPPEEQGMAMALFGMAVMLGPAVGPTLGGYIVDHWHWSWIFFINIPVGLLGLLMVATFVQEDEEIRAANQSVAAAQRKNIDVLGIVLLAVGIVALQYFLEEGQRDDWFESSVITTTFIVAVVMLAAFVIREMTAPAPAVNLRLFKDATFTSGTLIGALMFAMLMANMFLLPLFMQEVLGFTATQSGMTLVPRVVVMMITTPIIGRLYNRVSPRLFVGIGVALVAFGSLDMSRLTLASGFADVVLGVMIQGVGFACLFVPLSTVALSKIPRHQMPDATGLNSLLRQIGGAIGLAIFTTLLSRHETVAGAALEAHVSANNPIVQQRLSDTATMLVARGIDAASAQPSAIAMLAAEVREQATVLSFEWVFLVAGVSFLLVLPLLAFLRQDRTRTGKPAGAELHA